MAKSSPILSPGVIFSWGQCSEDTVLIYWYSILDLGTRLNYSDLSNQNLQNYKINWLIKQPKL